MGILDALSHLNCGWRKLTSAATPLAAQTAPGISSGAVSFRGTIKDSAVILTGRIRSLFLFDVGDAIALSRACEILGASPPEPVSAATRPGPDYVRFERPPLVEKIESGLIKYYDYGVVSYEIESEFCCDWQTLIAETSNQVMDPDDDRRALEAVRPHVDRIRKAIVKPYSEWLTEDYHFVMLTPGEISAQDLLNRHGAEIAQIVRGEVLPLSESERLEVLQSRISYYPNDLLVVGWSAAFIYDSPAAAGPTLQLLEYANTQLLEFRHYDRLLTKVLAGVYVSLEKRGFFRRWRMAKDAEQLNTIRLDIIELTERFDNVIKFVSDMFYARMYRMASARVGVPDYRRLVEQKLQTAGALYEFMMEQFRQARGFMLEVLVVIILLIEIAPLFRGK